MRVRLSDLANVLSGFAPLPAPFVFRGFFFNNAFLILGTEYLPFDGHTPSNFALHFTIPDLGPGKQPCLWDHGATFDSNVVPNCIKMEPFIDKAALNASYKAIHIFKS